jgi:hypothetical protein
MNAFVWSVVLTWVAIGLATWLGTVLAWHGYNGYVIGELFWFFNCVFFGPVLTGIIIWGALEHRRCRYDEGSGGDRG